MKYTTEQMILAAHVRNLALDFWKTERNALSDKWHTENPGEERAMSEFANDLRKSKSFNEFIANATQELENIAGIMLKSKPETENQN